ncbi:DUF6415 family natural product biosynthesis protein [Streptomyces niveiscabiei]|uniref:DUF6415 family natural product biosynthesis protein n=1 Tax=Streptomyces niveiscabiei TaxID=164115 RepID=A0ABW9HXK0_9ACTN
MPNRTAEPPDRPRPPHPGLTLHVYKVDRHGTITEDQGPRTFRVDPKLPPTPFPARTTPCTCPRCREAALSAPPDLTTMRTTLARLLGPEGNPVTPPPPDPDLDPLIETLRGHLHLLLPEIEAAALKLDKDSVLRYCCLACVGEARQKLGTGPHPQGEYRRALRLAHSLNALCEHYEELAPTS